MSAVAEEDKTVTGVNRRADGGDDKIERVSGRRRFGVIKRASAGEGERRLSEPESRWGREDDGLGESSTVLLWLKDEQGREFGESGGNSPLSINGQTRVGGRKSGGEDRRGMLVGKKRYEVLCWVRRGEVRWEERSPGLRVRDGGVDKKQTSRSEGVSQRASPPMSEVRLSVCRRRERARASVCVWVLSLCVCVVVGGSVHMLQR